MRVTGSRSSISSTGVQGIHEIPPHIRDRLICIVIIWGVLVAIIYLMAHQEISRATSPLMTIYFKLVFIVQGGCS